MVLIAVAVAGCAGTTSEPTAKYAPGDVVQVDPSDPNYSEYAALLVVDVGETYYTCEVVVRESPTRAWMIYPDNQVTSRRADLESGFPHRMDRVDVSSLAAWTDAPTQAPTPTKTLDTVTIGEKNALRSAEQYLRVLPFSREGLIDQLEFEGFTHSEAVYGVDRVGANWNEQAAKSAEGYLEIMSFSRSGLIDQLEFEGFTRSQAEYGVKAVGY